MGHGRAPFKGDSKKSYETATMILDVPEGSPAQSANACGTSSQPRGARDENARIEGTPLQKRDHLGKFRHDLARVLLGGIDGESSADLLCQSQLLGQENRC